MVLHFCRCFIVGSNKAYGPIQSNKQKPSKCRASPLITMVKFSAMVKKFYELVGGKEIWIPLGDCLLREVE